MELLQLRYFLVLAESEHLSRSAEQLHISPPSLSMTIKKLENELGISLFDRNKNHLTLNDNGRTFYSHVRQSIHSLDLGVGMMRQNSKLQTIHIALTSSPVWIDMIFDFEQSHPNIPIEFQVASMDLILKEHNKKFDFYLGIIEDIVLSEYDFYQVLPSEKPVVLLPYDHPLAHRSSIELRELREENFISVASENTSAHNYMMNLCHTAGFEPIHIFYSDYLTRIKLLKQKRGVAITTKLGVAVNFIPNDQISVVPLTAPLLTRTQAICWKKDLIFESSQQKFLEFGKNYFKVNPPINPEELEG